MNHFRLFLRSQSGTNGVGFKTRGDDGHLYGLAQRGILTNAHDDVGLASGLVLDVVVDFPDFVERDFVFVGAGNNQQKNVFGAADVVVVEQGAVQGTGDGVGGAVGTSGRKGTHEGGSTTGQNGLGVAQVDVGAVVVGDDFGDAAGCGGQYFVGFVEAGFEAEVAVYFAQFVVVHHNE